MEYIEYWVKIVLFIIATFLITGVMIYLLVLMIYDIITNIKKIYKEIKKNE